MRSDKSAALKLRLRGKSYTEIKKALGIPKGTLSAWFSDLVLSEEAQKNIDQRSSISTELLIKRNRLQSKVAETRARSTRQEAKQDIGILSKRELWLIGIGLYWAEGYKRPILRNGKIKTSHPVRLTNSDPEFIKIYLRFIRECCGIPEERIKAEIRIYQYQNANYLLDFWSKITNISNDRFGKFYYGVSISSQHKKPYNILPYGTIQISVNSTSLYHRIMGWIDGLKI